MTKQTISTIINDLLPLEIEDIELDPYCYRICFHLAINQVDDLDAIAAHCKISKKKTDESMKILINHQIIEKSENNGYHINPSNKWMEILL